MVCIICLCLWIDVTPCLPRRDCYAGLLRRVVTPRLPRRVVTLGLSRRGCRARLLCWGCRARVALLLHCYIVLLHCYIFKLSWCYFATLLHSRNVILFVLLSYCRIFTFLYCCIITLTFCHYCCIFKNFIFAHYIFLGHYFCPFALPPLCYIAILPHCHIFAFS